MPSARSCRPCIAALIGAAPLVIGARLAAAPLAAEAITSLAAGATEVFALRGNAVVTFDAAGRELGRCARFEAPPSGPAARAGAVDAEEALRLAGLPDDDLDSSEAEEALEDEGLGPRRRARAVPDLGIVAHALAASAAADQVWIATSAGLYRGRGGGCVRVALDGRDAIVVGAADGAVAAATEDLLWRADDGGPLRVAAGLPARPRALAVVDGEHTLIATEDALIEVGPYGAIRTVLETGADAIAVCGGIALAFAADGVWTWRADMPAERAGDRPRARTVTCGAEPDTRFIAAGGGVFTSTDGAVWLERTAAGATVGAAGARGGRTFIAVGADVVALDDDFPAPFVPAHPAPLLPGLPPLPTRRLLAPALPWPLVTVVLADQRAALRDGWSVVVLFAFRFGRSAAPGDARQLAAELVRRDARLAAEELALSVADDPDPSRGARLRAVREEREALR